MLLSPMRDKAPARYLCTLFIFCALFIRPLQALSETEDFDAKLAEADALAEKLALAPFQKTPARISGTTLNLNANTLTIKANTLRLKTSISGVKGSDSGVAGAKSSMDDMLSRLGAEQSPLEVRIRLPGLILFAFDEAELRPDAIDTLNTVKKIIDGYKNRPVRIEGYTCNMGSEDYNQKLSEERAKAVFDWLRKAGIPATRLKSQGFGESKPFADNSTESGRSSNRRVEVVISKQGK